MSSATVTTQKALFVLSCFTSLFWTGVQFMNLYRFRFTVMLYEIISIPMLLLLFVLPIILIIQLIRQKPAVRTLNLISLSIIFVTLIVLMFIG